MIMTEKQWEEGLKEVMKNRPKLTGEEKKKLRELGEMMKKTTYEERRQGRLEEDRKNGFM